MTAVRTDSALSLAPPAAPPDELATLHALVRDLQDQLAALRREVRQLQAKVARQPRIPITLPLRLEESPQAVSAELPKHFPPPEAAPVAEAPPDDWSLPDVAAVATPEEAAPLPVSEPLPLARPPKPRPVPPPADDFTFVAGRQPPPRPRPAPQPALRKAAARDG